MKKRALYVFLMFGVFFALLFSVKALTAQAPKTIPSAGTHLYGTVDEEFDFSKISFKPSAGSDNIVGKKNLRKIRLATTFDINDQNQIILSDDWFTAYCLDHTLNYPESGLMFALYNIGEETPDYKKLFERALLAAIYNEANTTKELYNLISTSKGYIILSEGGIVYSIPEGPTVEGGTLNYSEMVNKLYKQSDYKVNVLVTELNYAKTDGSTKKITGAQINSALNKTGDSFEIELTRNNVLFNKYVTTNMGSSVPHYNWVLWIIEHSYPNLTLSRMYEDIGVSLDTLEQQIVTLEGLSGTDKDEVNSYVENYVYATIQYAIWYVTGSKINGIKLGNELIGSTELNKIYQYFILNRGYDDYGTSFENKISVVKPQKTEIAEESKTAVKFGPYTISSKMVSAGDIEVKTDFDEGVKIVDEAGQEISYVKEGEKFYVIVEQGKDINEVEIFASAESGMNFDPATNRGRIYYAHDPLTQTVGTGGVIKHVTARTSFKVTLKNEVIENVNTGINSVATVFILSLIVFSLGYLLISYKNKAVEL